MLVLVCPSFSHSGIYTTRLILKQPTNMEDIKVILQMNPWILQVWCCLDSNKSIKHYKSDRTYLVNGKGQENAPNENWLVSCDMPQVFDIFMIPWVSMPYPDVLDNSPLYTWQKNVWFLMVKEDLKRQTHYVGNLYNVLLPTRCNIYFPPFLPLSVCLSDCMSVSVSIIICLPFLLHVHLWKEVSILFHVANVITRFIAPWLSLTILFVSLRYYIVMKTSS